MKYLNKSIKAAFACLIILAMSSSNTLAGKGPGGPGGSTPAPEDPVTQVFDTSFAVEFS